MAKTAEKEAISLLREILTEATTPNTTMSGLGLYVDCQMEYIRDILKRAAD